MSDQCNPRLLTLSETASLLRISPHTVRKMIRQGRIRPTRICRRVLVSVHEVDRFLAAAN